MKKLTIDEQVSRIQTILGNKNIITCDDCGLQYLPMTQEAARTCPVCNNVSSIDLVSIDDNDNDTDEDYIKQTYSKLLDRKLEE